MAIFPPRFHGGIENRIGGAKQGAIYSYQHGSFPFTLRCSRVEPTDLEFMRIAQRSWNTSNSPVEGEWELLSLAIPLEKEKVSRLYFNASTRTGKTMRLNSLPTASLLDILACHNHSVYQSNGCVDVCVYELPFEKPIDKCGPELVSKYVFKKEFCFFPK